MWPDQLAAHPMALTMQFQPKPPRQTVRTNGKGKQTAAAPSLSRKAGGRKSAREYAPGSARACKMGVSTRDGRVETYTRDLKLRRERGQEFEDTSIPSDYPREQEGDHVHADSACSGNADSLQRYGATYRQTTSFAYLGGALTETRKLVGRGRPADPHGVYELQALHA